MPETNLFRIFTDRIAKLGVRYVVTGSVAGAVFGEPRVTLDVDIVLELPLSAANQLGLLFPPEEFYCPPLEVVQTEVLRSQRGHFNLIHHDSGLKADIYLRGRDELNAWALDQAIKLTIQGHEVSFAPPESVILSKLLFYREGHSEKHLRDIRSMLKVSKERINRDVLEQKVAELGLEGEWKLVK